MHVHGAIIELIMTWKVAILGFVALCSAYAAFSALRPMPVLRPVLENTDASQSAPATPNIAWASTGSQALGIVGSGVLAVHGSENPAPIASVAKIMVALAVLHQKPLQVGEQGPTITLTSADVQLYRDDLAEGQSVAAVQDGEQLTEYQALQGLLLPSANNLASTLTNWAFGSKEAYLTYANAYAKTLGMTNTTFVDASGFEPGTVSTATDLVLLGEVAMRHPVLAEIVGTYTATIPVAGKVTNVNRNLASNASSGLNGIKTGNTTQAGGCFLFSSTYEGHTLIGAIVAAPDLDAALQAGPQLMSAFKSQLVMQTVKAGQTVAHYNVPWDAPVNVIAKQDLAVLMLRGQAVPLQSSVGPMQSEQSAGATVGNASFTYQGTTHETPLVLARPIVRPGFWWRVLHP